MRIPDFLIVGAPKSGTTALWSYLQQHPGLYLSPVKELHFFGTDLEFLPPAGNFFSVPRTPADISRYLAFFEGATPAQMVGEASVWYLYSLRAALEIYEFNPEARIIIMLRNPVDFLHSLHSQALWEGNENIEDFMEALSAEPDRREGRRLPPAITFRKGLYYSETVRFAEQVQRYFQVFPRSQVLVIIFEEMVANLGLSYRQVLEFLGVDAIPLPNDERVNPNKKVKNAALRDTLRRPGKVLWLLSRMLPRGVRRKLREGLWSWNTVVEPRAPLSPEVRRTLHRRFLPEVCKLEEVLGREIPSWKMVKE